MAKFEYEDYEAYKDVLNNAYDYMRYTELTYFEVRQIIAETFSFCNINSIKDLRDNVTKDLIIETIRHQLEKAMKY